MDSSKDKEPDTLVGILKALKELVVKRNKLFGITERIDIEKAKTIDPDEREIFANMLDEMAEFLDSESISLSSARVVAREGRITEPDQVRETGVYLPFQKLEHALTEAANALRHDAEVLRRIK
jgi:hypothetical protein